MVIPNLKELSTKAFKNWQEDNAPRLAASFSFYAMLALSPMLVVAVAIASRFLGTSQAGLHIVHVAQSYLGKGGSEFLEQLVQSSSKPTTSIVASVISIGLAIFGASNLFQQLSDSVNYMWGAKPSQGGIKNFLIGKVTAIVMMIVFAALFVAWLAVDSWLGYMERHVPGFQGWQLVSLLASTVFLTFVFAASFRAMPQGMVAWGDVWYGAIAAAIGFALAKFLLGLYFAYSGVASAYGSAGALVIILLWIYYSAQIYFFGLELVYTYAHLHGSQSERKKGAQPIPVPTNA